MMDLRNRRLQRVVPAAPVVVEPAALRCPITHELFRVPVTTEVGHAYERAAVLEWWQHAGGPPYRVCQRRQRHALVDESESSRDCGDSAADSLANATPGNVAAG